MRPAQSHFWLAEQSTIESFPRHASTSSGSSSSVNVYPLDKNLNLLRYDINNFLQNGKWPRSIGDDDDDDDVPTEQLRGLLFPQFPTQQQQRRARSKAVHASQ